MNNQYIESVKNQQNATYDIDREPFEVKILDAMNEPRSIGEDLFWLIIVDKVAKACAEAFKEMFPKDGEVR